LILYELTVIQAKRFGIVSCLAEATLSAAARQMVADDISGLVVVDQEGYLQGVITRTDLLNAYNQNPRWGDQLVSEYMNTDVVTVSPHDHLDKVARILIDRHIHRVVVVDESTGAKRPLGVISDADLLYHMVRAD
jgi:CBS domain-containing protein